MVRRTPRNPEDPPTSEPGFSACGVPRRTRPPPLCSLTLTHAPAGRPGAFRLVIISGVLALAALIASEVLARRISARIRG